MTSREGASSFLANPTATIESLKRWRLHTKKSLGQHFLVDDSVVRRILDFAEVGSGETILEVGPGIGTLTVGLIARGARVIAVETDPDLPPVLRENASLASNGDEDKLVLLEMDALHLDEQILSEAAGAAMPRKFVANLPYAVAATLVLEYFQKLPTVQTACVMVQAEVADRMCAVPGTKDYGAYTVKLRLLAEPKGSFAVKPGCFLPPPRVDSKVIKLERRACASACGELAETASLLADAAFSQRRKTIRNSMRSYLAAKGYSPDLADAAIEGAGIDPRSRGEVHEVEAFVEMAKAFLVAKES